MPAGVDFPLFCSVSPHLITLGPPLSTPPPPPPLRTYAWLLISRDKFAVNPYMGGKQASLIKTPQGGDPNGQQGGQGADPRMMGPPRAGEQAENRGGTGVGT